MVALLLVSGALIWQIGNAQKTVNDLQDADHNIATATYILALTGDEESGVRGFQNTSNEAFLQPFENAQGPLAASVSTLRKDLAARGKDTHLLDQFLVSHRRWLDTDAAPMIALVRSGGDTRDVALNLRGKEEMDRIRDILNELISEQKLQRQNEVEHWQTQVRHTLEAIVGCAALIGLLIGLFARSRLHTVTHAFQGAITALRKNAQATYDSEQRLRTTLTSIGDGVVVCDQHGRVELLNTIAEQLTGWTQAEAAQRPISEVFLIVDEASRDLMENPVDAVLRTRRAVSLANHAVLLRRGSGEIQIDDSGAPIFDRSGELAGVVMVFRDVTEQRRTQAALLASEKLAVTGRLAATLAHEIHNPLDSVVNLLYLMKNGATPEETVEFLDLARSELDRVTQISRAMLRHVPGIKDAHRAGPQGTGRQHPPSAATPDHPSRRYSAKESRRPRKDQRLPGRVATGLYEFAHQCNGRFDAGFPHRGFAAFGSVAGWPAITHQSPRRHRFRRGPRAWHTGRHDQEPVPAFLHDEG